jgi:hypothetical protein
MSLSQLHTFIRKTTRLLYTQTKPVPLVQTLPPPKPINPTIPDLGAVPDQNQPPLVTFDPQAHIIPLCIDYILVHELAEERSLAYILQLDEKEVRKGL